jgi:hypothetical protein
MSAVPRTPERPEPRHLDPDKLRLPVPRRPAGAVLLVLAVVFAVAGAAVSAAGVLGGPERVRAVVAGSSEEPSDDPAPTQVADVPGDGSRPAGGYQVVEAITLEKAEPEEPEQEESAPGRSPLAERAERAKPVEQAPATTIPAFNVAMINILGSQHTAGGKGGYAPGTNRAYTATEMLLNRGSSIIGFSEIQADQLGVFTNNAPGYAVYPGTSLGGPGVPQTLAWNTAVWTLVDAQVIYIPFSGQTRPQPVVKLAHNETGVEIWVMNVHNSPQGMEGERDRAEAIELAKINELTADGTPMIAMGDFNEKQEILCRVTASTSLESVIGGGSCYPPPQQMRVDWIFASPSFSFGPYAVTRESPVPYITDHAVLFSTLSLG